MKKLRLSDPWNYKVPVLIAIPYFFLSIDPSDPGIALINISASFCTIFGIAGFGYFLNDLTDIEQDKIAGKPNAVATMDSRQRAVVFIFFLLLAILPWIFIFPFTPVTAILLCLELLLFILYSIPPFRFKEKAILGVITDALYAHVLPSAFAAYTFFLMNEEKYSMITEFIIALTFWQLFLGLRNILIHQLDDFDNDQLSQTKTWATKVGKENAIRLIRFLLIPGEVIAFVVLGIILSKNISWFFPACLMFVIYTIFNHHFIQKRKFNYSLKEICYLFLDDFYKEALAIIFLFHLVFINPLLSIFLIIHLLVFRNVIFNLAKDVKVTLQSVRQMIR